MTFPDEVVDWAVGKLMGLADKPGFPKEQRAIESNARALLRIAHPIIVQKRMEYAKKFSTHPNNYTPTKEDLGWLPDMLELAEVPYKNGSVKPIDWLIEQMMDTVKFYPSPIEMRDVFAVKFPTADPQQYETPAGLESE